jgi:hypothetical protein
MRLCAEHQDKLGEAIKTRGLDRFVRPNKYGEDPDPVLAATYAIVGNALQFGGAWILLPKDDGTVWCPICFLIYRTTQPGACACDNPECTNETRAASFERWVEHAADEQLRRYSSMPVEQSVH